MVFAWKLAFYIVVSLLFMTAPSEQPIATMAPTPISETTLLAPTPSPTGIPGEIMDNIAVLCLCMCVCVYVCVYYCVCGVGGGAVVKAT